MFGKALLLLVGAVAIVGILSSFGSSRNTLEADARLAEDEYEILARTSALAGLGNAEQKLADEVNAATSAPVIAPAIYTGTHEGISYTTTRTTDPTNSLRILLHSEATTLSARGDSVNFDVQAIYEMKLKGTGGGGGTDDEDFVGAVRSGCDVEIGGSFSAETEEGFIAEGDGNANVYANGNLSTSGSRALVKGFGRYHGAITGNERHLMDAFQPVGDNSTGEDPVAYTPDEIIVEPANIMAAGTNASFVDTTFYGSTGNINFSAADGTADDPYVVYIAHDPVSGSIGNLSLNGSTIPPYTIFLIEGDLDVNGNVLVGPDYPDIPKSAIAFYIGGDLRSNGNSTVYGQFYVNGEIDFGNGNGEIHGNMVSVCDADLSGSYHLFYRPANPDLNLPALEQWTMDRDRHSEW